MLMAMNNMSFKTNINTEVAADEVRSAFKSDRRIWSFDLEKGSAGHILHISAEVSAAEIEAKIRALGFEATAVQVITNESDTPY